MLGIRTRPRPNLIGLLALSCSLIGVAAILLTRRELCCEALFAHPGPSAVDTAVLAAVDWPGSAASKELYRKGMSEALPSKMTPWRASTRPLLGDLGKPCARGIGRLPGTRRQLIFHVSLTHMSTVENSDPELEASADFGPRCCPVGSDSTLQSSRLPTVKIIIRLVQVPSKIEASRRRLSVLASRTSGASAIVTSLLAYASPHNGMISRAGSFIGALDA